MVELAAGVLARHNRTNARLTFWDCGESDARGHYTGIEERFAEFHGAFAVANDDWSNRRLTGWRGLAADVKSSRRKPAFEVTSIVPETRDTFWFVLQKIECSNASSGDRRRMRGGEKKRPGAMVKILDQVARSANVSAQRANRFGKRTHLDVHASMTMKVIHTASAIAAEHTRSVRVVHHHDGAVLVGKLAQFIYRTNVPIHRKDTVGDE